MKPFVATALLSILLLAGCGSSPPTRYYVLTPGATGEPAGQAPAIGVGPVTVAAYLDRAGLVYRLEGNRLRIADNDRWAEPLDSGVGRVLALNLAALLDTADVRRFPWHASEAPEVGVRVNVLSLEAADSEAVLVAEWQVYRPVSGDVGERHLSRFSRAVPADGATPAQMAAAGSDLLYQLSQEIAAAVRHLKS